jgi:hypothetical protein
MIERPTAPYALRFVVVMCAFRSSWSRWCVASGLSERRYSDLATVVLAADVSAMLCAPVTLALPGPTWHGRFRGIWFALGGTRLWV